MKSLVIVCLLSSVASAEIFADEPPIYDRMLGMRIGFGEQSFDDRDLTVMSLGLTVEHRVVNQLRISGEYEYVFLGRDTEEKQQTNDGSGHRASLILRHHFVRTRTFDKALRFYLDLEVGAGFFLGSEEMIGTIARPHALAGVRLGYDFIRLREETRASKVWEPEVVVRAIAVPGERLGFFLGVGMGFGD